MSVVSTFSLVCHVLHNIFFFLIRWETSQKKVLKEATFRYGVILLEKLFHGITALHPLAIVI